MKRILLILAVFLCGAPAFAQLKHVAITERAHALVGPLGNRDFANLGNNATFGVVVTNDGVVLIDAGGTREGAKQIDRAIDRFTDLPVRIVINSGGQDHRWLGNSYWAEQGARIIASEAAVLDQTDRASLQLTILDQLVGDMGLNGTEILHATETFADEMNFTFGGVSFEIRHAPAHTPGDSYTWVPSENTVFTGDIVYTKRLLGVVPVSNTRDWLASFEAFEALHAEHVVPGHGNPTDILEAATSTYDYLSNLREQIGAHIETGGTIMDAAQVDQSGFAHLYNFDILSGRNAQAVFEEMEWD